MAKVQKSKVSLVDARAQVGISQLELSRESGISVATIQSIESNLGRAIRRKTAWRLLGVINRLRSSEGMPELTMHQMNWVTEQERGNTARQTAYYQHLKTLGQFHRVKEE